MDQAAAKQQVVERIKQAPNILVTVSNNPSVDQLSACIGLTLLLNKMGKHATAVFSGQVPSIIEFLQPEKTIEANTNSLQDFIISLDKAKADKLRYKVEDDVVRIFITPYRASLSEKDLVFSQGDFNVDVVLALGVKDRAQLDKALTAHGRILHDATVVSINTGSDKAAELGQLNWQEPTASSLSEMLVSISEAFGPGLIDNQIATAFLTGIVAETKRFSNTKTSPKVMTMSAQLMAAGANQQLIVSKLEPPAPPPPKKEPPEADKPVAKKPPPPPPPAGVLNVAHEAAEKDGPEVEVKEGEIHIDEKGNIVSQDEEELPFVLQEDALFTSPTPAPPPASSAPPPPQPATPLSASPPLQISAVTPLEPASQTDSNIKVWVPSVVKPTEAQPQPAPPTIIKSNAHHLDQPKSVVPSTPAQPLRPSNIPGPHTLLDPANHQPTISPPFSSDTEPPWSNPDNANLTDPLSAVVGSNEALMPQEKRVEPANLEILPPTLGAEVSAPATTLDSARSAVENAVNSIPFDSAAHPLVGLNAQPLAQPLHQTPVNPPPPVPPPIIATSGSGLNQR